MNKILSILLLIIPFGLTGQDTVVVTKNFHFTDGVYLSFEAFRANSPDYSKDEVAISQFTNPQTFIMQVDSILIRENNERIDPEMIWGICEEGIPYIRLPEHEINRSMTSFSALKLRGKICYFTYPDWRVKKVPITAYNPLNGRPFLKSEVERAEQVIVEKILNFETGEIRDFNYPNLLPWIEKDRHLVETLEQLPAEEVEEKLFRALLIFVDRHEAVIIH